MPAAAAIALILAIDAGVVGVRAVPAVLRTGLAGVALFALCGFAPARMLARDELDRPTVSPSSATAGAEGWLMVLPLGAALSSMSLAVLGLFHVPFGISLPLLVAVAFVVDLLLLARARPQNGRGPARLRAALVLPIVLATIVGLISLVPIFRSGFATVPGQNGDAILVVGSAVLVEHAPPTATRLDLPINHIPVLWRSKYPIYYALAAVSTLAKEDPIKAFATVAGLILALTAIGWYLFARLVVRAPPWVALLAMFLVPLDRIVMYVTIHPYYNELWGQFALPFILLFGWRYLVSPNRQTAGVLALFLLLGLLAYPLMLPFPLFFLLAGGWLLWRRGGAERPRWLGALKLPRLQARPLIWIPAVVIAIPVVLVLVRGFVEKAGAALSVLAPWTSLANWHGNALGYLPWPHFVGMPGNGWPDFLGLAAVAALAVVGLWQMHGEAKGAMSAMMIVTVLVALYFRVRTGGELFFFKDLAFLSPYVLLLALVALGRLVASATGRGAVIGVIGLALALVVVPMSAAREIDGTFDNATTSILALHQWDRALPRGTSVRIDVPPTGIQLWTTYMFSDHPLSALAPLGGFFPHPPQGRKAAYVIAQQGQPRPADAVGPPLLRNAQFKLWRMNPKVPGPDVSSRRMVDVTSANIGV